MHLLLTAFWHQHSKFQSAQEGAWAALSMAGGISSQTQPAPWITAQCLINTAGQTSARYLLPNDPTNKSHQSDENLCFRGCWIMQEHSFFLSLPKSQSSYGLILGLCSPDCLWVHTQLCVIPVPVCNQLLRISTTIDAVLKQRVTCVQVYPWGQALPFCRDDQRKQHEIQLRKYSRFR